VVNGLKGGKGRSFCFQFRRKGGGKKREKKKRGDQKAETRTPEKKKKKKKEVWLAFARRKVEKNVAVAIP